MAMPYDSGQLAAGMDGSLSGTDASTGKIRRRLPAATLCLLVLVVLLQVAILAVLLLANGSNSLELEKISNSVSQLASMYRWPRASQAEPQLNYECLYARGGGTVGSTGNFPGNPDAQANALAQSTPAANDESKCKSVFNWYFANGQGQYWADLAKISNAAIKYYTAKETFKKDGSDMLVFDIDETVLSNLQIYRSHDFAPFVHHALYAVNDSDSKQVAGSAPGQAPPASEPSDFAPALDAIKDVYVAAYKYGLSPARRSSKLVHEGEPQQLHDQNTVQMAFITGRSEGGRDFTQRNLKSEGFGEQCKKDGSGKLLRSSDAPCYVNLHMRNMKGDQKTLASVYKPQRRQKLHQKGYRLVGTFGDQFSDLEGAHSALASWKLPNPLYYIL